MRRFVLTMVLFLTLTAAAVDAQNTFVYVRYRPADGSSSVVVEQLNRLWSEEGCQVMLSYGVTPVVATNDKEFGELKERLLDMQSERDYLGQFELSYMDSCFVSFFDESVSTRKEIRGTQDRGSRCVFIISENMFNSLDDTEYLRELVRVNSLEKRMDVMIYTYNDYKVVRHESFINEGTIKYLK